VRNKQLVYRNEKQRRQYQPNARLPLHFVFSTLPVISETKLRDFICFHDSSKYFKRYQHR